MKQQIKKFIKEVCENTWGLSKEEIKNYCLMLAKQNLIFSQYNKQYLETAKIYAEFAGIKLKDLKNI